MDVRTVRRGSGEPLRPGPRASGRARRCGSRCSTRSPSASRSSPSTCRGSAVARAGRSGPRSTARPTRSRGGWRDEGLERLPRRRELDGRRDRAGARAPPAPSAAPSRSHPPGFWTPRGAARGARTRWRGRRPQIRLLRPAHRRRSLATAVGRTAFGWQVYGRPWAVPADELRRDGRCTARRRGVRRGARRCSTRTRSTTPRSSTACP